ncbi:sigma factor-like helix-turn-helix DNA-binding protein [Coralloluteibacterium thermophilus]|uniref:Sigma factor-like helix-turn-helix DNA-binding protein n=1 Tax=Coralloluteibacterium thermophilum TaxID=2707049 RepID=A0ABV9NHC0_9GAMM
MRSLTWTIGGSSPAVATPLIAVPRLLDRPRLVRGFDPAREARIVALAQHESYRNVGAIFGISGERVSQIVRRAQRRAQPRAA